jgi:DNA-binding Lrp family transcriptional regulator
MELDKTDRALVDAVLRDANQRLEDLARLVALAPSSVHDRLRRLEREGVIRRWTVDVDATAFGLQVLAFVGLRSSRPCSELTAMLAAVDAIEECHSVAGANSMLLKVRVATPAALLELIERLRQIPGVDGTETSIVLKSLIDRPLTVPAPASPVRARERSRR